MTKLSRMVVLLVGLFMLHSSFGATAQFLTKNKNYLTAAEKTGWANWAKEYNMSVDNWDNSWELHYYKYESAYWAYVVTEDIGIINNALTLCKKVYDANNVRARREYFPTGNSGGKPTAAILPGWPHDQHFTTKTAGGQSVIKDDAGGTACGVFFYAVAARMIMETPSIWNNTPPSPNNGKTYRQWAEYYANDGVYTLNANFMKYFVDPSTKEIRYQYSDPDSSTSIQQKGNFSPFNRAGMAAFPAAWLVVALEELDIHSGSRANYKNVVNAFLDSWINDSMKKYASGGRNVLTFPYRWVPANGVNGQTAEDLGHGGYDVWQFQGIWRTGQYPIVTEDIWSRFAATMVYVVKQAAGVYTYRLDGTGSNSATELDSHYRLLSRWDGNLRNDTKRWDPAQALSRGAEEAQIQIRVNGGSWLTTKSIHVKPGDTVEMNGKLPSISTGWTWTGPNSFSSSSRLVNLGSVTASHTGTYKVKQGNIENYVRIAVIAASSGGGGGGGGGSTTGNVLFYQHGNYGGYVSGLNVGDYTLSQLQAAGIVNDDISSIKVSSGYKVTIYQHGSFTGFSTSFTADVPSLTSETGGRTSGNWNDDVSSVKIEAVSGGGGGATSVTITSPSNGSSFSTTDSINVTTSVAGTFQYVSFAVDGSWVGQDTTSPYTFSVSPLSAGSHTIKAYGKLADGTWADTDSTITVNVTSGGGGTTGVTITGPSNGSSFSTTDSINVTTSVAGTFQYVSFAVDGSWVGQDTTSPYTFSVSPLSAGSHTIKAYGKLADGTWADTDSTITVNVTSGGGGLPAVGVWYRLVEQRASKAMDVPGSGTADGTSCILYTPTTGHNQQWKLQDAGSGYYYLISRHSNKALTSTGTGNGSDVVISTLANTDLQKWQLQSEGSGAYSLKNKAAGTKAIDAFGTANLDNVGMWEYHGNPNQDWLFEAM